MSFYSLVNNDKYKNDNKDNIQISTRINDNVSLLDWNSAQKYKYFDTLFWIPKTSIPSAFGWQ